MNKIVIPLAAIGLILMGIAFAIVSTIVFLSKGKSAFWINKKMKFGGLLLTLSSLVGLATTQTACVSDCYDEPSTFTDTTTHDVPSLKQIETSDTIKLSETNYIKGFINCHAIKYMYSLKDEEYNTLQSGLLPISKDDLENYSEKHFAITIDSTIQPGNYNLFISDNDLFNYIGYTKISITE